MVMGLSILGMMACSIDFENRTLPDPTFHAEDVFGQNRTASSLTKPAEDPFAELSATAAQPDVSTQNLKSVSFAGMVKSSLPHDVMWLEWCRPRQRVFVDSRGDLLYYNSQCDYLWVL